MQLLKQEWKQWTQWRPVELMHAQYKLSNSIQQRKLLWWYYRVTHCSFAEYVRATLIHIIPEYVITYRSESDLDITCYPYNYKTFRLAIYIAQKIPNRNICVLWTCGDIHVTFFPSVILCSQFTYIFTVVTRTRSLNWLSSKIYDKIRVSLTHMQLVAKLVEQRYFTESKESVVSI